MRSVTLHAVVVFVWLCFKYFLPYCATQGHTGLPISYCCYIYHAIKCLIRGELSQNFRNFIANIDIFLADLHIFWSNFVVTGVFALFNIFSLKKSLTEFYKTRVRGEGSMAVYKKKQMLFFSQDDILELRNPNPNVNAEYSKTGYWWGSSRFWELDCSTGGKG